MTSPLSTEKIDERRSMRCATEGCQNSASMYFEYGGVGSHHCVDCYDKIMALFPPVVHAAEPVADLLGRAADVCERYHRFIMEHVKADDLEMHPYPPEIESIADELRAVLSRPTSASPPVVHAAEPVAWACTKCNSPRSVDPCPKCGTPLTKPADGWEWPTLPDVDRIRALAREVGYAVGVHGSLERDLDLIAAPWVESAVGPYELALHISAGLGGQVVDFKNQDKPCGRWSCNIHTPDWTKMIDLSVMPPASPQGDGHSVAKPAVYIGRNDVTALVADDMADTVRAAFGALPTPAFGEAVLPLYLSPAALSGVTEEQARFPKTLGAIHQAVDAYVDALVARQHGGIALDRAMTAVCAALGRSPIQEMDARRLAHRGGKNG